MAQRPKANLTVTWFIPVAHRDYNRMGASVWIRCLQLLPYLEERGITCLVNESDADADIAVFVRSQNEAAYQLAKRQKARGRKIVFDLCVNYFDETETFPGGYGTGSEQVAEARRMVEVCDVVTCASQNIADRAKDFHSWVEYVSDSIDLRHFRYTKSLDDFDRPQIRAIWSGAAQKSYELGPLLPLLRKRKMELVIITSPPRPKLRDSFFCFKRKFPYRFTPWTYQSFPERILDGECCISCRSLDTPYNKGHSLFKIGVFMAQGVPALASPVPSYREAIGTPGQGGRICDSLQAWQNALDAICEDRQLLKTWSNQSRHAMQKYSTVVVAGQYATLFRKLCSTDV
ncbi:MAG: glycosyltransferase [Lentisphaerae bacterium]|nr:glycosyltransferase [Lentisphaerota bacterium]